MWDFFDNLMIALDEFVQTHLWFAPVSAFLLPFLEACFPWLPLTAIVSFNLTVMSGVYGVTAGTAFTILLTVLGSFSGMFLIFLLIRSTLAKYFIRKVEKQEFGQKFLGVVQGDNVWMILVLLSNPFLPGSIMNYGLALTKIPTGKYVALTLSSRLVIILFLIFLGSIFNIQEHLWNVVWMMLAYFLLFLAWAWYKRHQTK
jgi:uncharacterized membrane protein YdjX (TVP38/TMEM64 family)